VGTRTSGSEGGGEQTTARKRGTAARLRPHIEIVRRTQRNVKRWSSGEMALRWTAAGMLEAERQFRKIIGHRDLATLVIAIDATTTVVVTPMPLAPRPRRPLSSSPPEPSHRDRRRKSTARGTSSTTIPTLTNNRSG
jgi:hypothetical protein